MTGGALAGKVALITGGAGGIGAAIARRFVAEGARVHIADVDEGAADALARELAGSSSGCDVSRLEDVRDAVRSAVAEHDALDIAVLNAAIAWGVTLGDAFDERSYQRAINVNVGGVVNGIVAALPALRERGGDIVATASLAGVTPMPSDPIYAATKHAVVGLVRSLGDTYTDIGVRINAVCPGFADTAMLDPLRDALHDAGVPVLAPAQVADAFIAVLSSSRSGECWFVQPGRPSEPFQFRRPPGPR